LTLSYNVPLDLVPPGARIVRIAPMYHSAGGNAQISDDWGAAVYPSQTVEWSPLGVGQANSSQAQHQVHVTAHCSFTSPFATFSVDKVLIYWFDPDLGY
jgi:hypothetical protein